jgi:hypothetical protein
VDGAVAGSVVGRVCRVGCGGGYLVVYMYMVFMFLWNRVYLS